MLTDAPLLFDSSTPLDQLLAAHFRQYSPVAQSTDGRIANCATTPTAPLCAGHSSAAAAPAPAPVAAAAADPGPLPRKARF